MPVLGNYAFRAIAFFVGMSSGNCRFIQPMILLILEVCFKMIYIIGSTPLNL
jgi:hypothetical protein